MAEFKLPDVGEGMHEGEITKWLVKEGDSVKRDQPVVEIQTDKVNAELTSPATGIVKKLLFVEGDVVEVGQTLFVIAEEQVTTTSLDQAPAYPTPHRILATPYIRQKAREMKIDIESIQGTGPAGRVTEEDLMRPRSNVVHIPEQVQNCYEKDAIKPDSKQHSHMDLGSPKESALEERIPLKGIRKKIAEHMVKSVTVIPHVTHVDEMDMDALRELRNRMKGYAEEKNVKLTFLPYFIKAIVIALKDFRTLNASFDDKTNEIVLKNYYHIGIATDTKDGLVVPVIKNADRKTFFQLASEISDLAVQAREGKLTLDQITGGTFTISNVGPIGGLYATPIINHPEAAILALHKMEPRMVVRNMESTIRFMMNFSLSFDHRLIDGVTAVRFTNRMKQLLENPDLLITEMI